MLLVRKTWPSSTDPGAKGRRKKLATAISCGYSVLYETGDTQNGKSSKHCGAVKGVQAVWRYRVQKRSREQF